MADEVLLQSGLYFDELNKIRVLEPTAAQHTSELKEECRDFTDKTREFQGLADDFLRTVDALAGRVEAEKMKAIGTRNLLKSVSKQREAQQQQMAAVVREKQMELERLKKQFESLVKIEAERNDFIEQFILHQ